MTGPPDPGGPAGPARRRRRPLLACAAAVASLAAACTSSAGLPVGPVLAPGAPQADRPGNDAPIVRIHEPDTPLQVAPGAAVRFTGAVDDPDHRGPDAPTLRWDYGDGTSAQGPAPPAHRYAAAGSYLVTLSAQDPAGASATPSVRLVRVGDPGPSGANLALSFGGTGSGDVDRVKIPLDDPGGTRTSFAADIGATDTTIELWLRADPGANRAEPAGCGDTTWIYGNIVLDRDRYALGRSFGLSLLGGVPVFGIVGAEGTGQATVCGVSRVDDGRWHHVAVTREQATGALALFVDGAREGGVASGPAGDVSYPDGALPLPECPGGLPCTISDPYLVIGAEKHDVGPEFPAFRGQVDELRLSTTVRYPAPFTPPTSRFGPDGHTAALYHFDEGEGPIVTDSASGPGAPVHGIVRRGGRPAGPGWVPSDAPTGP